MDQACRDIRAMQDLLGHVSPNHVQPVCRSRVWGRDRRGHRRRQLGRGVGLVNGPAVVLDGLSAGEMLVWLLAAVLPDLSGYPLATFQDLAGLLDLDEHLALRSDRDRRLAVGAVVAVFTGPDDDLEHVLRRRADWIESTAVAGNRATTPGGVAKTVRSVADLLADLLDMPSVGPDPLEQVEPGR